jgi:NADH-quinone oxidoreductase subunit N
LVVSFLSFAGIPPSAGLLAKLALVGAAIDAGYGWLALVAAVNSVISLAYYARVVAPMYFELAAEPAPLLGALAAVGIAVSAGGVLLVGIAAEAVFGALTGARLLPR